MILITGNEFLIAKITDQRIDYFLLLRKLSDVESDLYDQMR